MRRTRAECRALLRAEMAEYQRWPHRYFTEQTRRQRLPPTGDTAFTSLAVNLGIATRRLNASNLPGACDAITP